MAAKKIVLLSDGTGNGAAKRNRTNVWRLYRALDIHRDDQVAYYDDGVGSQKFLPLKLIGGAFGFGLKRNVIELYKFLCRNYEADDSDADKIYLFGFSRGAFTVRILAGMIDYCGLYTAFEDEADLDDRAAHNYKAFRSKFKRGLLNRVYRFLTRAPEQPIRTVEPCIEFMGVWDTVDAYGLPIDELAILWDWLIFPIRFPDCRLSLKVKRACHALAVDDERHTFHPVLWDESTERTSRIEQVWFAGAHSDVGGGYPKYDLALVALDWMMARVEAVAPEEDDGESTKPGVAEPAGSEREEAGLYFIPEARREILKHCDWHGVQHDSRAGFAAYYRYKPRDIARLCNDPDNGISIGVPKIHRGVLERIKADAVPYAPTGLPESYAVAVTRGDARNYEDAGESTGRSQALNRALDVVFWRQWLYAALLVTTLLLVGSRFFLEWSPGGICVGSACAVDPLLKLATAVLPDSAAGWLEALRQNPDWLWGFLVAFVVLFVIKRKAEMDTDFKSTRAWSALKGKGSPPAWVPTWTSNIRRFLSRRVGPVLKWAPATVVFVLILALLLVVAGRTSFHLRSTLGLLCETTSASPLEDPPSRSVSLDISNACVATGIAMQRGHTYRIDVDLSGGQWTDGSMSAGPDGFTSAKLSYWTPLRRTISEPWLKLLGQVGGTGKEQFAIGSGRRSYTARSSGELILYVNDAVLGLLPEPYWAWPYFWDMGRNRGNAAVTVTRLDGSD